MKLLIIDGHYLLFKSFYGIPPRAGASGGPVHGVLGFLGIVKKITRIIQPSHMVVVFDPQERPERKVVFSEYKSNRRDYSEATPWENPFSQLEPIQRALAALSIAYVEYPGGEADDTIATLARRCRGQVVIASGDKDFLQLINSRTSVFVYRGKHSQLLAERDIQSIYGVSPRVFCAYLALVGDASDSIPGVRGIGPKRARDVLSGGRVLTRDERRIFTRNRKLILLRRDIPIQLRSSDMRTPCSISELKVGEYLRKLHML